MSELIHEILNRDLAISTKRGDFSTPTEITSHLNALLEASYSTKKISLELQSMGWKPCGTSRARRRGKPQGYYFRHDRKNKALLQSNAKSLPRKSNGDEAETLASVDHRFRVARADKERALANTRKVETTTA